MYKYVYISEDDVLMQSLDLGLFINYVDRQGGGGFAKCQHLSTRGEGVSKACKR